MGARTGLLVAVLALLQGCGDSPPPAAPAGSAQPALAPDVELAAAAGDEVELGAVQVEPRMKPRFRTFDQAGGSVALGKVTATFDPGAIEGRVDIALVRAAPKSDWTPEWAEQVRPTGEAFSLATRGAGQLRGGRIAVELDPAAVPEGWQPAVLCRSAARACARDPVDIQGFHQLPFGPDEARKAAARADALSVGRFEPRPEPGGRAAELLAFTCLTTSERGRLEFPITAGDAPGDRDVFEVVLTKEGLRHDHLVEGGRLFACVYYTFPPSHELERYHATLVEALQRARQRAQDLGFADPPHPLAITVVDEIRTQPMGGEHLQAATSATRMALRNDLHVQAPRGEPGELAYTVAHEYFHAVQAFSMTLDTYNAYYNDWGLEGGAEWFAHTLYDNFHESWPAPAQGLERHSYGAAAFWKYLADRHGEQVMAETLGLLLDRALGGRKHAEPSLQIAYGLRLEESSFTEALDRVLQGHGESLSEAWRGFAPAYLYRRTFESGDQGTAEKPGLWYGLEEHELPVRAKDAWEEHSLLGTTAEYPLELHDLTQGELSAAAVRLTDLFDRGTLHVELRDVKCFMGGMEPGFCRELGTPRVRVALYGERAGEVTFLGDELVAAESWSRTVESFGRGGDYESVVLVLGNEGWRRRRDCPESAAETWLTEMHETSYKLQAYLSDRQADRAPSSVTVDPPAGGRVWCVSKSREEDEDGNRCFGTISAAIANQEVEEGHELVVDPDVYEEAVLVSKPLVIRSKVPGMATIKAPGQQVVTIAASHVSIANFVLIGGQSTTPVVGVEPKAHNAYVAGNVIVSGGPGVAAREAALPVIASNWIACSQRGISVDQAAGAVIEGNVIAPPVASERLSEPDVSGARVEVPPPPPGVIEAAIEVYRSQDVSVADNEVLTWEWKGNATFVQGLHALDSPGLSLHRNVFRSANGQGALIGRSSPVSLTENLLGGHEGLVLFEADEVTATGNLVEAKFDGATLTQVGTLVSARNRFICGEGGALVWALELLRCGGVSSAEDFLDGRPGGGLGARECGTLSFERCRFAGVDTCADIEETQTALFNGCAFEQSSAEDNASDAGDGWALRLSQVGNALVRDSSVAAPGRAVRVQGCTVPIPWQGLRLTQGGYAGVYVEDTLLELEDAVLHPKLQVPLKAERGEVAARNLRLAYPDGDPLALMKTLSLAPGVLWADDLSREMSGSLTALLPWWWTIHAREAVADPDVDTSYYRLRFELDLERTPLPVPLGEDAVAIVCLWPPPVTIPVKVAGDAGAPAAIEVDVDMVYENPDEKSSRRFALMLIPKARMEKR